MDSLETTTGAYHFSPEGLKLISSCPLCKTEYQPFQANIVDERNEAQLVHIQCQKCQSSVVALIMNGPMGLSSVGLITDLSSADVERFKDEATLSETDVLNTFKALINDQKQFLSSLI